MRVVQSRRKKQTIGYQVPRHREPLKLLQELCRLERLAGMHGNAREAGRNSLKDSGGWQEGLEISWRFQKVFGELLERLRKC